MKRLAILTAVATVLSVPLVAAQAPPPPNTTAPAPAHKVKFVAPVKGWADIEVQRISAKPKGKEIFTIVKVKNISKGALNLLKVEQYWYNKQSKQVSFGDYAHRKAPLQPGEVLEITIPAPYTTDISHDMLMFSHAYGKINAKTVKKIE